jgi:hypothetical protein
MVLTRFFTLEKRRLWLCAIILIVLVGTIFQLRNQGRLWICACGKVLLWSGDIWSSNNSQHLFDPYSFTHLLHGVLFCGLLALIVPSLSFQWRFSLAVLIESLWEVIENSAIVIDRYREATLALGYEGDTIINSIGDIAACALGFILAHYLRLRWSTLLFIAVELVLLVWIKDSLLLNIIMLIYPVEAIRAWQMGQ